MKIFLLADTNIKVVLGMFFLSMTNENIKFNTEELTWRKSTIAEAMLIVKQVEFIIKFKFIKVILDKDSKTYVVYLAILRITKIYFLRAFLLAVF